MRRGSCVCGSALGSASAKSTCDARCVSIECQSTKGEQLTRHSVLGSVLASLCLCLTSAATVTHRWRPARAAADETRAIAPVQRPLRVLFVGNSHTYTHDMPQMVVKLAAAAEEPRGLAVALEVAAGATLAQHLSGGKVHERLSKERWDYVVLQEQQQISSYTFNPKLLEREFIAPGRTLDILARAASAKTILYMTAARRAGDAGHVAKDDYEQMQERSRVGYMRLAHETGALVAPVGLAWRWARNRRPQLPLWANDGYHPSLHGSYLAACVFYGLLYDRAALDNPFTAGLPAEEAGFLQRAADVARHL